MKQKLLLFIALFCFLSSYAQTNPPRSNHFVVPCGQTLTDSGCNLIPDPYFRYTGNPLEAYSNGNAPMWQDINNLTTDINAALAAVEGWNPPPAVPSNLTGKNISSMLVDNLDLTTEGIAGRIFQLTADNKYALSFFLSSSDISNYRTAGGNYAFKIFLTNCQNFDSTSSGNPEIIGESQLIYCRTFENMGDSDWQQFFVTFTAENSYNMIIMYPEVSGDSYDGGAYVHMLYPELIPINPTNQYSTYNTVNGTEGLTLLSACGVTNGSYLWESAQNGIMSNQVTDVLGYDINIGEDDEYKFTMWVEGAFGNDPLNCEDNDPPIIQVPSTQLATSERVSCPDPSIGTNNCNLIPNATFRTTRLIANNIDAFRQDVVPYWASVNGGSPDINGAQFSPPPQPFPVNVPVTANAASMFVTSSYYEGIYAKTLQLVAGRTYAFSFFLNVTNISDDPADFNFNITLSNCQQFPMTPTGIGTTSPPNFITQQPIFCQHFQGVETIGWQQYFMTFTADANYDMIAIFSNPNPLGGASYVHFLMPELIDVTNLITVSQSSCNYNLQACGVTNATYQWVDGNNNSIGNTAQINVNAIINPEFYTLTLTVPDILNNPILNNTCSNSTQIITSLAFGNRATWVGGDSGDANDWNIANNWDPKVVPNDALTDVLIPSISTAPDQPTIYPPTNPGDAFQIHSIKIEPTGILTNNGTLKIARSITGNAGSISNYNGSVVAGNIEMNGTCAVQLLTGNVFVGNDVNDFKVSNNVTITAPLDVYRALSFGGTNRTLITNGDLTLVSNASTTANVAQIDPSNFIDGAVTVERHILTGLGGGEHAKTWQALATPTGANSIGQTVKASWMEGGNNNSTGYGTHIPDPSWTISAPNGFDDYASIPSIKTYNYSLNSFDQIANTSIPLYNKNGYFIFIRGDRSVTDPVTPAVPTNMRSKGALFQPHTGYTPPSVTVQGGSPGKFELIGNPYASAIDIDYMRTHSKFSNLTDNVIVWDPLIPGTLGFGGYQVLSASSTPVYTPTPGGTSGNTHYVSGVSCTEIQSGQAFFMQTTNNGNPGSVTFDESVKSSNSRVVTRMNNATRLKSFRASLFSGTGICDGNTIMYDNGFTNDIDAVDIARPFNPGENFMITKQDNTLLTVEARANIKHTDSIFYTFKNLRKIKYQLVFAVENLQDEGLNAILIDNYLQQEISLSLSDSSFVDFIVNDNKASYENRFIVIFNRGVKAVPLMPDKNDQLACRSFVVYPNPTENKTIIIQFVNQPTGMYKLQLVNYAGQVVFNSNIKITDANGKVSVKPSSIAGGSYQLAITAADGRKSVQQVVIK